MIGQYISNYCQFGPPQNPIGGMLFTVLDDVTELVKLNKFSICTKSVPILGALRTETKKPGSKILLTQSRSTFNC